MLKLVPKYFALISALIIPISFILFVELIKKLSAKKIQQDEEKNKQNRQKPNPLKTKNSRSDQNEHQYIDKLSYREKELLYFFPRSFIFLFILVLTLYFIGPFFNFDIIKIYFSSEYNNSLSEKIINTIIVQIINIILYSGLLIQFIFGNEDPYHKPKIMFLMENIYSPFLEEVIYRGVLFTILKSAGFSGTIAAILSSLTFSLSHFRHVFDVYFCSSDLPKLFFQSFYTLFFGLYSSYAYNFSGTILAPIILHGVCNTLQLPRTYYLRDDDVSPIKKKIISVTYIAGIVSWGVGIYLFH